MIKSLALSVFALISTLGSNTQRSVKSTLQTESSKIVSTQKSPDLSTKKNEFELIDIDQIETKVARGGQTWTSI